MKAQGTVKKDAVRAEVRALVHGPSYMTFDDVVADFPMTHINTRPPNVPYTPWHLLEHMRITQRDILEYIEDDEYRQPDWPDDYWPKPEATARGRRRSPPFGGTAPRSRRSPRIPAWPWARRYPTRGSTRSSASC